MSKACDIIQLSLVIPLPRKLNYETTPQRYVLIAGLYGSLPGKFFNRLAATGCDCYSTGFKRSVNERVARLRTSYCNPYPYSYLYAYAQSLRRSNH